MVIDRITSGSRPVAYVEPLVPAPSIADPRQEAFDRLRQMAIGKQFQAEILARLNDGSFMVRMANSPNAPNDKSPDAGPGGATARMRLPAGAQVGAFLDLTLVAKQPRLTFLLDSQKSAAPARPSDASTTSLSSTGRLIGKLLRTAQQDSAPATLVGKAPLLASPAVETPQIATALQNTLVRSGLFYESHLGQWAAGARPLAELLREPQNQATLLTEAGRATAAGSGEWPPALQPSSTPTSQLPLPSEPSSAPGTPGPNSAVVAPSPDPVVQGVPLADAPKQLLAASATPDQQEPDALTQLATPGPESARLINLQLDALEQRRVLWQGELWPGQPLSWEVSEQAPENDADEPTPSWQSTVHFALPTLGAVAATIRLANGHVQVQVRTATDAAAHSLRVHGAELAASLEAAGLALDALLVKHNAPD